MRRQYKPFEGYRFVLNKATGEVHDLDNEKPQCQIDEINPQNIFACNDFENVAVYTAFGLSKQPVNGCYYCNPIHDRG